MVLVPCVNGGALCVDSLETTRKEYTEFTAAVQALSTAQPAECSWNLTFKPDDTCESNGLVTVLPEHPQVCVNWCDARAYCDWRGKRLCRGNWGAPQVSANDEWIDACSAGDTKLFPYGNEYEHGRCHDGSFLPTMTAPPGSTPACEGGSKGLFDMSGNVDEWIDMCSGTKGSEDQCGSHSGHFTEEDDELACKSGAARTRDTFSWATGIRCCL